MPESELHSIPQMNREETFVAMLDLSISFHRRNTNDPYGIGNAVLCSLLETRNAFAKAYGMPLAK